MRLIGEAGKSLNFYGYWFVVGGLWFFISIFVIHISYFIWNIFWELVLVLVWPIRQAGFYFLPCLFLYMPVYKSLQGFGTNWCNAVVKDANIFDVIPSLTGY
jgi:hypothetical protein